MVGMSATDVLIAGQAGVVDLAGMNLGANIWNMIVLFFMGIGLATQPLVAKQFGAGNDPGIKHQLHQSLWLCLALGVVATLATLLGAQLLLLAPFESAMQLIAHDYLVAIALCALPISMIPAVRGTLEGMSLTRVVFFVNFAAFLINIPLDYALVHGVYGFPKLGGVGCAWATVLLTWAMFFALAFTIKFHRSIRSKHLLAKFDRPRRASIIKTLKLGLPIGISIAIELSMFCGAGVMIALFGTVEASAHAVAITIASLSFMLYVGLGQGVTIRASQFLGANKPDNAWYSVKVGTSFNLVIAVCMCVLYLSLTPQIVSLFTDDFAVAELAVVLLLFGAAFQIADCLQVAVICALRAYHDTTSPPKYQFVAFWVFGLPIGVGLAFYNWWPGLEGAKGLWMAMVLSLFTVGLLLWRRLATMVHHTDTVALADHT